MKNVLFIALLFFTLTAQSKVIESNHYSDVLDYITPTTLFVTDLDNTVIHPAQTLGSDQWAMAKMAEFEKHGFGKEQATLLGVGLFSLIQHFTQIVTVESTTPDILRKIDRLGAIQIGLTARPILLASKTLSHLEKLGVSFNGKNRLPSGIDFKENTHFEGGVVFAGSNNKGETLKSFLEKMPVNEITRVVFIDDKAHHTQAVDDDLKNSRFDVISIRYGAADELVRTYNPEVAKKQWDTFLNSGKLISDSEAGAK